MATLPPGFEQPTMSVADKLATGLGSLESQYAAEGGVNLPFDKTPIGQAVARHYQRRLAESAMHYQAATTLAQVLASGQDPTTGNPLTPQQRQQYLDQWDAAYEAYAKSAGIDKQSKSLLQRGKSVVEHIFGRSSAPAAQAQAASAPPPAGSVAGAPSQAPAPPAGGKLPPGARMTPPPATQGVQGAQGAQGVEGTNLTPQKQNALAGMETGYLGSEMNARMAAQMYMAKEAPTLELGEQRIQMEELQDRATNAYRNASLAATQADRLSRLAQTAQNEKDRMTIAKQEADLRKRVAQDTAEYHQLMAKLEAYRATRGRTQSESPAFKQYQALQSQLDKLAAARAAAQSKSHWPFPSNLSGYDAEAQIITNQMHQLLQANPDLAAQLGKGSSAVPQTATMGQVRQYASQYGMSVAQARKAFENDGIKIAQ